MSDKTPEQPERKRRTRKQVLSVAQARMQRSYKMDETMKERFLLAISKGMSETKACAYARINTTTYFSRKKQSLEYLLTGIPPNDTASSNYEEWAAFIEDVECVMAEHEMNLIDDALDVDSDKGNKAYWARNMTILERRNRADWGKNETLNHNIGTFDRDERFL